MKKCIRLIFMLMSIWILNGCTQNNGYIGPIFGSWSLISISEDGIPLKLEDETTFSFQNKIVQVMKYREPPYTGTGTTKYGNFTISDDVLTMQFQLKLPDIDNYVYMTPDWLYFPMDGKPIHFDIKKLNGSKMILTLATDKGELEYRFDKTW